MRSSTKLSLLASALLSLQVLTPGAAQIDPTRELSITHLGVVEDVVRTAPGGAWHFGTLMTNIAGDVPPPRFVESWLNTIIVPQEVNDETVFELDKSEAVAALRNRWEKLPNGRIDLAKSPFRLLAIVNRPDLVQVGPNGPTSYGECRFVYCAFDPLSPGGAERFFVIFEFDVPAYSCSAVVNWANAWHGLATHPAGSPAYNAALQTITDAVVLRVPGSTRPNQSNLKQLRTNEFELLGMTRRWSLREWNLVASSFPNLATLTTVTTKQTPHFSFLSSASGREILAEYLEGARTEIQAGTHVVPDFFLRPNNQYVSFQSGNAENDCAHDTPGSNCTLSPMTCPGVTGTRWWAPGFVPQCGGVLEQGDGDVRHKFALQTCSGCHFQETDVGFTHVSERRPGEEAQLSKFLTGLGYPIPDPFFGNDLQHSFSDLARRASVLSSLLALDCNPSGGNPHPHEQLAALQAQMGNRVH